MALASFPARHGQQRSLARIFHALSWAFARSPGARSFAWARLASFCGSGLFLPLYGTFAQVLPWYPLSARVTRPGFLQLVEHAPDPLGLLVVDRAGQRAGDPQDVAVRGWR